VSSQVLAAPEVELIDFVPDLSELFGSARFLVCPILGKTGQQIKIIEAMAHGVPVIATRVAAEGGPLRDGVNGLVARNANEFAEHVIRLWNDAELRQRLGRAARATIAQEYSDARLRAGLLEFLPEAVTA
jgi:glycosyltransferase involved in cell wall biosynthesis